MATMQPFVYWAQTESKITLKIDLPDAKQTCVEFGDQELNFSTFAKGENYKFHLNLYDDILSEESNFVVRGCSIDFVINKKKKSWWPRLIAQPQKPHWLKIDFEKWQTKHDNDDDKSRNVDVDYPGMYEKLQKEELGYIRENGKKVYLIFYNLAQFIGYLYIVAVLTLLYYRDGEKSIAHAFEHTGNVMKFVQLIQFLEVLHPIFGYTKGGALVPFVQVMGRNFILFIMINMEERMQTKPVIFYVFYIWSLIEIIRYPYYLTSLMKKEISFLTWLRYTLWIPLYPAGFICEGIIVLRNIAYFDETKRLSIELPNKWNFSFDMPSFLKFYLLLLILPGSYLMMTHMSKTRAKKLSSKKIRVD